jgi:hypothetical protein
MNLFEWGEKKITEGLRQGVLAWIQTRHSRTPVTSSTAETRYRTQFFSIKIFVKIFREIKLSKKTGTFPFASLNIQYIKRTFK